MLSIAIPGFTLPFAVLLLFPILALLMFAVIVLAIIVGIRRNVLMFSSQ